MNTKIKRRSTLDNQKLSHWLLDRLMEAQSREMIASTSHNTPRMEFYHRGQKDLCNEIVRRIGEGEFDLK